MHGLAQIPKVQRLWNGPIPACLFDLSPPDNIIGCRCFNPEREPKDSDRWPVCWLAVDSHNGSAEQRQSLPIYPSKPDDIRGCHCFNQEWEPQDSGLWLLYFLAVDDHDGPALPNPGVFLLLYLFPFEIGLELGAHSSGTIDLLTSKEIYLQWVLIESIVQFLSFFDLNSKSGPLFKSGRFWCILFQWIVLVTFLGNKLGPLVFLL